MIDLDTVKSMLFCATSDELADALRRVGEDGGRKRPGREHLVALMLLDGRLTLSGVLKNAQKGQLEFLAEQVGVDASGLKAEVMHRIISWFERERERTSLAPGTVSPPPRPPSTADRSATPWIAPMAPNVPAEITEDQHEAPREPTPPPSAALPRPIAAVEQSLGTLLENSDLFRMRVPARDRALLIAAVAFLGERDGAQASLVAFANAMSRAPTRARGLVETLSERLNLDGYALLRYDDATGLVILDVTKVALIYGA